MSHKFRRSKQNHSIRINQANPEREMTHTIRSLRIGYRHHIRHMPEYTYSSVVRERERIIRYALMIQWFKSVYIVISMYVGTLAGLAMTV